MANQNLAEVLDSLGLKLKEKTKSTNIISVENFATAIGDIESIDRELVVFQNGDGVRVDLSKLITLFPKEVVNLPLCNWPDYVKSSGEYIRHSIDLFNVLQLGYLSGETTSSYASTVHSYGISINEDSVYIGNTNLYGLNIDYSTDTLKTVLNKVIAALGTTLSNALEFGSQSGETFIIMPTPVYKDTALNTYIPPYKAIRALFVNEGE